MKKILISIILTIVLLYVLLSKITYSDINKLFSIISPWWLLMVWGVYFIYLQLIRLRFSVLMHSKKIGLWSMFSIVTIHNLCNRLLPLKTGEASYVYLLKRQHALPAAEGTATLVIARIFDYVTVSLFFVLSSLLLLKSTPPYVAKVTLVISVLLLLSIIILFSITAVGLRMIAFLEKIFAWTKLDRFSVTSVVIKKSHEVIDSFRIISSIQTYLYAFLISSLSWGCMFFMYYLLLRGMNLNTHILKVVVGSTFCVFTNILPLHGVAGLGTYETGWTLGFLMVGFSKAVSISSAFIVHLFFLITGITYGLIGFMIYWWQNRKGENDISASFTI
jgi:uncharacterized protein (TIRG00374 family)